MKKVVIILIVLIVHIEGVYSQNFTCDTSRFLINKDSFKWRIEFTGGSDVLRYVEIYKNKIYTAEFTDTSNTLINFLEIDKDGNYRPIPNYNFKKQDALVYYAQCLSAKTGWQKSTKYLIPLKDSILIKKGVFEYYQSNSNGADVWSNLLVTSQNGTTVKFEFSHNPAKEGYISVNDLVQFNSSSFVVLYWYYKRFGDSNVQIGFLDLKDYLKD